MYYAHMAARINSAIQACALGERLRSARIARAITLKDLEKITGVHHSQISRFERGVTVTYSKNLQKICKELAVGLVPTVAAERVPLGRRVEALLRASPASEVAIDTFVSALEHLVADSDGARELR